MRWPERRGHLMVLAWVDFMVLAWVLLVVLAAVQQCQVHTRLRRSQVLVVLECGKVHVVGG